VNVRAVVQRVSEARVVVAGEETGRIEHGLLVFLGVMFGDLDEDLEWMTRKIPGLRIFADDEGKMARSVVDVGGSILLVSQFTLSADVGKGTRPSFTRAMAPAEAEPVVERARALLAGSVPVSTGRFGASMQVSLVNDGPVTIWLDSKARGANA
jgi:D-tyrosyl-tRNA(Tyr) deacylase